MRTVTTEQARVLVIDDDAGLRELLQLCLGDEGYAVVVAANGREELDRLQRWRPRVILLDLLMPRLDGWGFRARQRAAGDLADIPVVVLTALPADEAAGLGAAAVLTKPFEREALLGVVRCLAGPPAA